MNMLAVSIGGTFTNVAYLKNGQVRVIKILTLDDEKETVLKAINKSGVDLTKIDQLSIATQICMQAISG
jgi:N-methylhydantoinase A/oxoprolinase/acetone carboxylase beta subunit